MRPGDVVLRTGRARAPPVCELSDVRLTEQHRSTSASRCCNLQVGRLPSLLSGALSPSRCPSLLAISVAALALVVTARAERPSNPKTTQQRRLTS